MVFVDDVYLFCILRRDVLATNRAFGFLSLSNVINYEWTD